MNSLCHQYLNQNILPFVGREGELRRLNSLFREFLDEGESKYVLIAAESGSGKTRMVREFEERLAKEFGETCVIVHARYLESNVAALTPIVNGFEACLNQHSNLKQYLQKSGLFPPEQIAGFVSGPGESLAGSLITRDHLIVGDQPPLQVLLDSFNEIAKRFPLVLVLEDIHNMDDLPVFDQFFLGLSSASKFVVVTERREGGMAIRKAGAVGSAGPIDASRPRDGRSGRHSSSNFLREVALREERTSDVIVISDFAVEETRQLFNILFDMEPTPSLLETVHTQTEGRPLRLRTMLRQLVTMGVMLYEGGKWHEDPEAVLGAAVPDAGEQEMLVRFQREVERLNDLEQTVAMHAALLGEQFDVRLLRKLLWHRLGKEAISDELFHRAIDLLTFKSIIRHATPSISFLVDRPFRGSEGSVDRVRPGRTPRGSELGGAPPAFSMIDPSLPWGTAGTSCYEFSHAHFWNTILESARDSVAHEHDLILAIVWIAGTERLPLYSSAFLSITSPPFALVVGGTLRGRVASEEHLLELGRPGSMLVEVEHFLDWSAQVVRSLWSQEPQECLRLLLGIRPMRDEIAWRFGPELSEPAMGALLDLHTMLVEAHLRNGFPVEAERDLEQAAVLEKFVQAGTDDTSRPLKEQSIDLTPTRESLLPARTESRFTPEFQGITHGRIATLRAIICAGRTSYAEFERWATEARTALEIVPKVSADRGHSLHSSRTWNGRSMDGRPVIQQSSIERAYLLTLLTRTKGEALLNAGRFQEADALIEQGMPTAMLLADTRFDEYSLYYRLAVNSKLKQDQNEQASELTRQIMGRAKEHGNTLVETMFLFQAALAAFSSGEVPAALAYCELGISNGRRYGIQSVEIMSYLWRMIIAGVQQDAETVKECSQQLSTLVEDARAHDHSFAVVQSPNLLQRISLIEGRATAMNFLGRYHAALEFAEEAIQLAASHQNDSFAAWAQNEKALALIGLGRFEESVAVAKGCVALSGEQRLAERTAHTALIMAYAGMGRFEEARREVELVRPEYNDRNPYYLRFALAEARLLRLLVGRARTIAERQAVRQRLELQVEDMLKLARSWDAPLLEEQLRKEFEGALPKRISLENADSSDMAAILTSGEQERMRETGVPSIRLFSFGPLLAEQLGDDRERSFLEQQRQKGNIDERSSGRDNKVRQLISVLVATRAEVRGSAYASEAINGRAMNGVRNGADRGRSMAQGGTVTRETLLDLLWPDSDTSNANGLHSTIKRARAFLGNPESILLNEEGYQLGPMVETDCEEVLRHYDDVRQARKRNALFSITFHYEQIVKLTDRGPFMGGLYGSWLDGLRTRLATVRRTAAVRLIEIELERGLLGRAEEMCLKLLAQDEFDEEALRGLLMINAKRRQTTNLVRLFDDYSKKLKTELRAEPSKELRTLYSSLIAPVA